MDADEALLIETNLPQRVRYWAVQLGDAWCQTTDYVYHHSSINGHQSHIDADGKFRAVLSRVDPGVPNWLDPVDSLTGIVLLRWYYSDNTKLVPTTKVVKVSDVRAHMPADCPVITPAQREEVLARRTHAALRRYHY